MSPVKEFKGTLRPRITYLGRFLSPLVAVDRLILESQDIYDVEVFEVMKDHFKIEWIQDEDANNVVWTEELKCLPGISFVPQIVSEGTYKPCGAMFIDKDNLRHRVLPVDMGVFGGAFPNQVDIKKEC